MATRKTITKAQAVRYRMGSRAVKSEILDVVCAVTGCTPSAIAHYLKFTIAYYHLL